MAAEVNNQKIKFTKTETEYNMKSIRFLLLTITAMFIAIALLMIVLGNSVYSHFHKFSYFYDTFDTGRYISPAALCVFLGLALLIVSMFGFFGSLKQSTCLVNIYALILILVFILKLVIVCLAFTADGQDLWDSFDIPYYGISDPEIEAELNFLQSTLGCCGSRSFRDYVGVHIPSNVSTVTIAKVIDGDMVSMVLPRSCCLTYSEDMVCSRMWAMGCKDALINMIVQNGIVIGVLGISVMVINLLGIIFALLLARCIRKMKSEKTLMAWKIKEQMIMARQAEEMEKKEQPSTIYIDHQATSLA